MVKKVQAGVFYTEGDIPEGKAASDFAAVKAKLKKAWTDNGYSAKTHHGAFQGAFVENFPGIKEELPDFWLYRRVLQRALKNTTLVKPAVGLAEHIDESCLQGNASVHKEPLWPTADLTGAELEDMVNDANVTKRELVNKMYGKYSRLSVQAEMAKNEVNELEKQTERLNAIIAGLRLKLHTINDLAVEFKED